MSASVLSIANAAFLRLEVRVEDSDWAGYDRLEVWRSVLGEAGPYEELSAQTWMAAFLPQGRGEPSALSGAQVNVVGKTLELLVNERVPVSITFTGTDPLTLSAVASQISAQGINTVFGYVDTDGVLVVGTLLVGGQTSLRVVGGDAAPLLGLPLTEPDCLGFGQDPRLPLVSGQKTYSFSDYWSEPGYFYRTRFSNSLTGVRSGFSEAISAKQTLGIDPSHIAIGYVRLLQNNGRPAATQEVTVFSSYKAGLLHDAMIVGGPERFLTDANGYVEFPLLRGAVFDIGLVGSPMIRRVTVPTDTTVLKFNVFDPDYGQDDNFTVQRADIPYAQRTTL